MKKDFEWKKHILECLQSTDYCSIATSGVDGLWNNPVYFVWDDTFNLYFISKVSSKHMQNLSWNNETAVAIYKTEQKCDVV